MILFSKRVIASLSCLFLLGSCTFDDSQVTIDVSTPTEVDDGFDIGDNSATWPPIAKDGAAVVLESDLTLKNYYVVFDGSGSMDYAGCSDGQKKIDVAKKALTDFAATLPQDVNLGLVTFDISGINEKVPLARSNRDVFRNQVAECQVGGATPLKDSIALALAKLTDQARKQLGYGEYHLVVVTDGEAYPEDQDPRGIVQKTLSGTPVVIHTVGFCVDSSHSLNQPGKTVYHAANNPEELAKGLKSVLAESADFNVDEFK